MMKRNQEEDRSLSADNAPEYMKEAEIRERQRQTDEGRIRRETDGEEPEDNEPN